MPLPHTGQELTAAAILCNDAIDLSSDEDLADDALEQLIKSKEEAEIFNNLPLFDVAIIHDFILLLPFYAMMPLIYQVMKILQMTLLSN